MSTDVEARLHAWSAAITTNDADAIAGFMTDDWVLVTPEVGIVEAAGFLDAVRAGRLTHATMTHDVLRARACGDDVVVLTTRGRNTGTFLGDPMSADEWTTDVFERGPDGRWRCSLTHLTPVVPASG